MAAVIEFPTTEQAEAAWKVFKEAVRDGRLVRPKSCAWCGNTEQRIHGHHPDYARPLMVVWLCSRCHRKHHAQYLVEQRLVADGF